MKILRIILSLLIIFITILITYNLVKGLDFDLLEYLDKKYHFLFLTLLTQIFGVYFSSKDGKIVFKVMMKGANSIFISNVFFVKCSCKYN